MLHNLTIGHFDPAAIVNERRIAVHRPLEMDAVDRLLKELGGIDSDGRWTLERGTVEFREGYISSAPGAPAAGATGLPRNSRSASSTRRDASSPTRSIRGSSRLSSLKG